MNATPYSVSKEDYILVEIMHNNNFIVSSREYGGEKWRDGNAMRVSFTVREAGAYKISVLVKGKPIRDSPFTKTFLPGSVSLDKLTKRVFLGMGEATAICRYAGLWIEMSRF